ncbi:MAG TPA: DUF5666 domain-containing protein [Dehalococcoidia bacterium]|jgi:hypothetical protein|nr:DUF5666 domain-containing protein [Dehalococcoidia bacterium]
MALRTFNFILDECLLALKQGESVETCLARYPNHAGRLRPLLLLAETVRNTPIAAPRPWPQSTAWHRVRQRAAELRTPRRRPKLNLTFGAWMRPIVITVAVLAALFGTVGGTALAAQNALPDSPLYRVKLATEEVRLLLVFDDVREAEILIDQSDERMDEILTMARQDKEVPGNVLSALRSRNERATEILAEHPDEADLLTTLVQQSEFQEENLILLFPAISNSAHDDYTEAVAAVHNARLPGESGLGGIQPEDLSDGVQPISGAAVQVAPGLWTVGGIEVRVDETTIGATDLQPGATASLVVGKNSRGQYRALTLRTIQPNALPSGSVVSGEVEEVTNQGIKIAGQFIQFNNDTFRKGKIRPGQRVQVTLSSSQSGVVASTVRAETPAVDSAESASQLTFEGVIRGDVKKSNEWEIGGLKFAITANTGVDAQAGEAKDGARALVKASMQDGRLFAESVTVLAIDSAAESAYLVGAFEDSDDGVWFVSGLELVPPVRTEEPAPGTLLALELRRQGNDLEVQSTTVIEQPDETGLARLQGTMSQIDGAFWTLEFGTVRVASTADFSGPEPVVGARALVWGRQNQNGVFEATYARVLDSSPVIATPTPAPEPQ